ncbi:hypothetical protein [Glutamicibacter uratoxydans]|uniref:hypothetical protein n=1 Tax=Glutamicibacter uratoxydans TaxID=43667 RepID=UPI001141DB82|nr:hypothetical protein [Glutamicibacter uratoxydans]
MSEKNDSWVMLDLCQDCAELLANGEAIPENPSMGEVGLIVVKDVEPEFKRSDCGACGSHHTGNFLEAEELVSQL